MVPFVAQTVSIKWRFGKSSKPHCRLKKLLMNLATLLQRAASDAGKCPIHIYTTAYPLRPHPSVCGRQRTAGSSHLKSSSPASRASPHHYSQGMEQEYITLLTEHQRERGIFVSGSELLDITPAMRKFKGMVARAWEGTWTVIECFST